MTERMFTRRVILEGALVSVTAMVLPACTRTGSDVTRFSSDGQFYDARQLTVLNDVAEIMIPRTETPGAEDAQVASVVDALMLTWAGQDTRDRFTRMLRAIESDALDKVGREYLELSRSERTDLVAGIDRDAFSESPSAVAEDYRKLKMLVFQVYYTSEEANSDYVRVPGQYHGDLSLEQYESLLRERAHG